MKSTSCVLLFGLLCGALVLPAAGDDELSVLGDADPSTQMLRDYLRPQVHAVLDERLAALEARTSPEEIAAWQRKLREQFIANLGGFPERTPLEAQVVGHVAADDYRIEKIIYQSRPQFNVTANLYLPKRAGPHPAVLFPCGHTPNGKAAGVYQRACILLAKNGFAVLCYDPVGQGERVQILTTDDKGNLTDKPRFGSTGEHTICGVAPILLGQSLATYRIWDGIRGIDYLCSREDIDATRIGCTGNSGGGLMTSYLMAVEPRIKAAAPGCFITITRIKNERPGPGDAEQNVFAQTRDWIDHPDFILLAAPRPVLICAATRDFVPIEGTWTAYRQAKRVYTHVGFSERVDLVEADERHGFSRPLRIAMTRWMRRWLRDEHEPIDEPDFPLHSEEELRCTPQGQVLLMKGARSLFDLYEDKANALYDGQQQDWKQASKEQRQQRVREVAGITAWEKIAVPQAQSRGTLQREGFKLERLLLHPEENVVLPALYFSPSKVKQEPVLYIHGRGKAAAAGQDGAIEKLVRAGHPVLAVDLRGYGETQTKPWRFSEKYAGPNAAEFFIAYMLGKSLLGMRADDVLSSARYLQQRSGAKKLHLVAVGEAGVPALHAAATAPEALDTIQLQNTLDTWSRVVITPVTVGQLENTIHGALRNYDLPDLIKLVGKDRLTITSPLQNVGE